MDPFVKLVLRVPFDQVDDVRRYAIDGGVVPDCVSSSAIGAALKRTLHERQFLCYVRLGHRKPFKFVSGFTSTRDTITLHFSVDPVPVSSSVCAVAQAVVPHLNLSPYRHFEIFQEEVSGDD